MGVRHGPAQGGWPENVDGTENEQVERYIKKATKEPRLRTAVAAAAAAIEAAVRQNNTIDVFEVRASA